MSSEQTRPKPIFNVKKKELNLHDINKRIENEICNETLMELTDEKLKDKYRECDSVKKKTEIFGNMLSKHVNKQDTQNITEDWLLELIPPGTKGVIRGNRFNEIVKDHIVNLKLDEVNFDVCFEKNCDGEHSMY